ncbi:MAG: hypothetical protein mread185_000265 [Mycoplasmataceae bacterium]|nr:MAG: hypothetical protein mread185_000265 [Mycoplasmataceae bacterium]
MKKSNNSNRNSIKFAKNGTNDHSINGKKLLELISEGRLSHFQVEKLERIALVLNSHKDPYKKKLELFRIVRSIEVGEIEPSEEKRINILYQGKIYNELAKQTLRDYKRLTVEEFSKVE